MNKKRIATIVILGILVLAADQLTKAWARSALRDKPAISLIDDYLLFKYYENPGVAFSLGRDLPYGRVILIVVGLAVLVLVWRAVRQVERRQKTADVAFALIAGGAIGNIVDRAWIGRVVDFIVMHWRQRHFWPAYNVADIALCVGVGLLLIAIGVTGSKQSTGPRHSTGSSAPSSGRGRRRQRRKSRRAR